MTPALSPGLEAFVGPNALVALDGVGSWLTAAMVRVSIDGALVALPVWLVCRFVASVTASARTWLWWCVSLKLLLAFAGAPALPLHVLPASWSGAGLGTTGHSPARVTHPDAFNVSGSREASVPGSRSRAASVPHPAPGRAPGSLAEAARLTGASIPATLVRIIVLTWMLAVALHLALLLRDAVRLRRLVGRARSIGGELADEHEDLAKDLGLRLIPRLRESGDVQVPQVVGVLRPTVLLPIDARTRLSARERTMTLCHELAHVRRHDLSLGWVPALAERLLVCHPLAWLAAREYALAREAACDSLVLHTLDTEPQDYGRLLVRLGVSMPAARVAAAGASPSARLLRRRLHMLQRSSSFSSRAVWLSPLVAAAVVALVPLRLVADHAMTASDSGAAAPPAAAAAVAAPATLPAATAAVATAPGPDRTQTSIQSYHDRSDGDRHRAWVYLYDDDSVSMSGGTRDVERARRLRGASSAPLFYVRRDDKAYVIDDPATLKQIEAIFGPMMELGRQQGVLGGQQGALGGQQGQLGARQGALGARQAELGARQAELAGRLVQANAALLSIAADGTGRESGNVEHVRRLEDEAKARLHGVDRQMQDLSEQQSALGAEQEALGDEQAKLGEQQAVLGEQQARLGELQRQASEQAERELDALVERAIPAGVARPVK